MPPKGRDKRPPYSYPEKTRHGRRTWVFRMGKGKRTRLPDQFGTDEWWMAYKAALSGTPAPSRATGQAQGTLEWLIARYMESGKWAGYGAGTRKQRSNIFQDTIKRAKNPDISKIDRIALQQAVDRRARTPAQANNFLKAMKGLFQWSLRNGHISADPTIGVERVKYKTKGFTAWTVVDVQQFCDYWPIGTKPRLALELFLFSGVRRGDLHVAGPQHMKGNLFSIRSEKTGELVTMMFPDSLIATIEQTQTGAFHFITKGNGNPFTSKESFGNWFGGRCRDVGLKLNAHGLRKLSATLLAEGGGTSHQLMARYGWANSKQAETYTKSADRAKLGIASSSIVSDQIQNILSPHPTKR